LNDRLNGILPPFINHGILGLNLGLQGMQFTATSTTAENQTLSFPMYVHSIPSNLDNQDIVSMGTNSALVTKKVIENSFQIVTIEIIAILQAIDFLKINKKLSPKVEEIYNELRSVFPLIESDEPRNKQIETLKNYLQNRRLKLIKI
jgi:histidine ammonia-lyase